MATNFTQKALGLRDELIATLNVKLASLAKTPSFGASGECDLLVGTGAIGSDSVFARFSAQSTNAKDVLGLAQQVWTPHVIQIVTEANPAGGAGADVGTWATRLAIIGAAVQTGCRVEMYASANGVAVSSAAITGAPLAVFDSLQYPGMATM